MVSMWRRFFSYSFLLHDGRKKTISDRWTHFSHSKHLRELVTLLRAFPGAQIKHAALRWKFSKVEENSSWSRWAAIALSSKCIFVISLDVRIPLTILASSWTLLLSHQGNEGKGTNPAVYFGIHESLCNPDVDLCFGFWCLGFFFPIKNETLR